MSSRVAYIKASNRPTIYDETQDLSNNLIDTAQQVTIDQSVARLNSAENRIATVETTKATITSLNNAITSLQSYANSAANTAQGNAESFATTKKIGRAHV